MRELVKKHADLEEKYDLDGVMSTLIEHPVYEFFPSRLRLEGKENIKYFYQEHFDTFFPLIESFEAVSECWDENNACLEYDLFLKSPHDSKNPRRIMVSLSKKGALLIGERFYVDDELAKLIAGKAFSRFTKFK